MNNLKETYTTKLKADLIKDLNLTNVMETPVLEKIVINSGIGKFRDNKDVVDSFYQEITAISGQKPTFRKSRISEAGFKVRKNDTVGITVTLRGERMWNFLEKFISITLPRVRDFKGVSNTSFDKSGNFSVGIKEQIIFPEVDANKTKGIKSLQLSLVFKNSSKEKSKKLLTLLGMPFSK